MIKKDDPRYRGVADMLASGRPFIQIQSVWHVSNQTIQKIREAEGIKSMPRGPRVELERPLGDSEHTTNILNRQDCKCFFCKSPLISSIKYLSGPYADKVATDAVCNQCWQMVNHVLGAGKDRAEHIVTAWHSYWCRYFSPEGKRGGGYDPPLAAGEVYKHGDDTYDVWYRESAPDRFFIELSNGKELQVEIK